MRHPAAFWKKAARYRFYNRGTFCGRWVLIVERFYFARAVVFALRASDASKSFCAHLDKFVGMFFAP
jgi:hypothetical protein